MDHTGRKISTFYLDDSVETQENMIFAQKINDNLKVTFQVYVPDAKQVSIIGSFNSWNPNIDFLNEKKQGVFTIEKYMEQNKKYYYLFFIDGIYIIDKKNPCVMYHDIYGAVSCYSTLDPKSEYNIKDRIFGKN